MSRPPAVNPPLVSHRARIPNILLGSLVITGVGQTLLYALLPLASRSLSLSGFQSSSVFALSALLWSLCSPLWGRIADRTGGRTVLVLGLAGQAASNLAVGLAIMGALRGIVPHAAVFPLLLTLRGINGVLGSAVLPSAQGLALRCAPDQPRIAVVGRIATCWSIGLMAGPGFAAVIAPAGLAVPLLAAACLTATAATLLSLRPICAPAATLPATAASGSQRALRRRIRGFLAMALANGTASALIAQSTGFYVQDRLGLSPHAAIAVSGMALSLVAGCSVLAQILAIRLRPSPPRLIMTGAACLAAAVLTVLAMPHALVLIPAMGLAGAGLGATTLGLSTAASLKSRADQQGRVAGALASASSFGAILSALGVMPFYDRLVWLPYAGVAVLAASVVAGAAVTTGREGRHVTSRMRARQLETAP
jgi:MFS family permease